MFSVLFSRDNYGFVTYIYTCDAYAAIESKSCNTYLISYSRKQNDFNMTKYFDDVYSVLKQRSLLFNDLELHLTLKC